MYCDTTNLGNHVVRFDLADSPTSFECGEFACIYQTGVLRTADSQGSSTSAPVTTTLLITDPNDICDDLLDCLDNALGEPDSYFSVDLHDDEVQKVWICVQYYGGTADPSLFQ